MQWVMTMRYIKWFYIYRLFYSLCCLIRSRIWLLCGYFYVSKSRCLYHWFVLSKSINLFIGVRNGESWHWRKGTRDGEASRQDVTEGGTTVGTTPIADSVVSLSNCLWAWPFGAFWQQTQTLYIMCFSPYSTLFC